MLCNGLMIHSTFIFRHTHTKKLQPAGILKSCDSERNENICSGIYHLYSKVKMRLQSLMRFFLHLTFLIIQLQFFLKIEFVKIQLF